MSTRNVNDYIHKYNANSTYIILVVGLDHELSHLISNCESWRLVFQVSKSKSRGHSEIFLFLFQQTHRPSRVCQVLSLLIVPFLWAHKSTFHVSFLCPILTTTRAFTYTTNQTIGICIRLVCDQGRHTLGSWFQHESPPTWQTKETHPNRLCKFLPLIYMVHQFLLHFPNFSVSSQACSLTLKKYFYLDPTTWHLGTYIHVSFVRSWGPLHDRATSTNILYTYKDFGGLSSFPFLLVCAMTSLGLWYNPMSA